MSLEKELKRANIELKEYQIKNLETFIQKLKEWSRVHNITRIKEDKKIIENIVDSLIPTTFIQKPKNMVDIGTGAGFPGLILAIAWDDIDITLSEPINKRASFLRYIATMLNLKNVEIFRDRVERIKDKKFELITSRAVTDTKLLLNLTKDISMPTTKYLFYKGSGVLEELDSSIKEKFNIIIKNRGKR
ncbi:MAG: 16S rRNA (guanine(527)-N(7))-methyltransferase RsmG, partial [Epsilonproteobacteria bacterium]|nr:16S rRNA (guanine(527)-N(7))-methyltransferase RsmG [Campylobacterota bacterium]